MSLEPNNLIMYAILELSSVTRQLYDKNLPTGSEGHFKVSYLIELNGNETVCDIFPKSIDDLKSLPMITNETTIQIMEYMGNQNYPIGTIFVGDY